MHSKLYHIGCSPSPRRPCSSLELGLQEAGPATKSTVACSPAPGRGRCEAAGRGPEGRPQLAGALVFSAGEARVRVDPVLLGLGVSASGFGIRASPAGAGKS